MRFRPYKPEDFDALYEIEEKCFQLRDRFSRAYMRQLIRQPNAATWIAEIEVGDGGDSLSHGDRLEESQSGWCMCGFAVVDWSFRPSGVAAYIQTIEVLPDCRGRGVGRALLGVVETSAREAGARSIWLHVEETNTAAIDLYAANGFELEGREDGYYGPGRAALIYAKSLSAEHS